MPLYVGFDIAYVSFFLTRYPKQFGGGPTPVKVGDALCAAGVRLSQRRCGFVVTHSCCVVSNVGRCVAIVIVVYSVVNPSLLRYLQI